MKNWNTFHEKNSTFTVPLEERAELIEVVDGDPCTIQAPDSEVQLQIPQGAHGVVFGTVHTNHQPFLHLISDSDCLICPVCEYGFHPDKKKLSPEGMFKLLIPHIVKDISKVRGHIQVRQASSKDDWKFTWDIPSGTKARDGETYWNIDKKYVTIHTRHFCSFIVTAEGINCCAQSAELLLFGSLKQYQMPTVTVKPYLGSLFYETHDYIKVQNLNSKYFPLKLKHLKRTHLLTKHWINILVKNVTLVIHNLLSIMQIDCLWIFFHDNNHIRFYVYIHITLCIY